MTRPKSISVLHVVPTGLGPTGKGSGRGFFLHSALMVDAADGRVEGLAGQILFYRKPKSKRRVLEEYAAAPADRESVVWGKLVDGVGPAPAGVKWVHVDDRGADDVEVFCRIQAQGNSCVIRAARLNRWLLTPEGDACAVSIAAGNLAESRDDNARGSGERQAAGPDRDAGVAFCGSADADAQRADAVVARTPTDGTVAALGGRTAGTASARRRAAAALGALHHGVASRTSPQRTPSSIGTSAGRRSKIITRRSRPAATCSVVTTKRPSGWNA